MYTGVTYNACTVIPGIAIEKLLLHSREVFKQIEFLGLKPFLYYNYREEK